MPPSKRLQFKTPAKINLGLQINKKRKDGFHELETLFQMVAWFDDIELEEAQEKVELFCDTPGIPNDKTNLVVKAARLLQNRFPGKCGGVKIKLKKNIPSGAGLGGGSGNAAGVLLALNHLWNLKIPRKEFEKDIGKLTKEMQMKIALFGTTLESFDDNEIELEIFPNII